jgi:hypothetical protein
MSLLLFRAAARMVSAPRAHAAASLSSLLPDQQQAVSLSTGAAATGGGPQQQLAKQRRTVINKIIAGIYVPRVEEFHPQLVNGKWNKPKRSARMRAKMKKTMATHGIEGWRAEFEPTAVRDSKLRT